MKARVLQTKFWEDDYILSLTTKQKCLYNFYLTNSHVGMTGIYEIAPYLVGVFTGLTQKEISEYNEKFMNDKKLVFHKNWVKIVNADKYQNFSGKKNEEAKNKELEQIPDSVIEKLDTLSIGYQEVSPTADTPNNHYSLTSNHNHKHNKGIVKGKLELPDEELQNIADKYQVPISFVRSKQDDVNNWIDEKPSKARGRNLKATLTNWVKRDAINIIEKSKGDPTKRGVDASNL